MLKLLSLSQLEHKARNEDNALALAILECLEDEINEAVELATEKNDADYYYEVFNAVQAVEFLIDCTWYKLDDTKQTKDKIIYMIETISEETSPCNNQVQLWKYKGCDSWTVEVKAGQYGESLERAKFEAKGFKEAQGLAVKQVSQWIRKGTELNV